jgi:hypothetical protein
MTAKITDINDYKKRIREKEIAAFYNPNLTDMTLEEFITLNSAIPKDMSRDCEEGLKDFLEAAIIASEVQE